MALSVKTEEVALVKSAALDTLLPCSLCVSLVCPLPWLSAFLFETLCLFLCFLCFISCCCSGLLHGVELRTLISAHCLNGFSCPLGTSAVWADLWWLFSKGLCCVVLVSMHILKNQYSEWYAVLYFKCQSFNFCFVFRFFFIINSWCKLLVIWHQLKETFVLMDLKAISIPALLC